MMSAVFRRLMRRLWRERRRVVICALLFGAAGAMAFWGHPDYRGRYPMPLVAGLAFAAILTGFTLAVSLVLPAFRHASEVVALGICIMAWLSMGSVKYSLIGFTTGSKGIWFLAIVMLAGQVYWSNWVDRFLPTIRCRFRHVLRSKLPADVLWDGLFGTPGHPERLADAENILTFEPLAEDSPHRRIIERGTDGVSTLEENHYIEEIDPPRFVRFRWNAVNAAKGQPMAAGAKEMRFIDAGSRRKVRIVLRPDVISLRATIFAWIDDSFGRIEDARIAELERRERNGIAFATIERPGLA